MDVLIFIWSKLATRLLLAMRLLLEASAASDVCGLTGPCWSWRLSPKVRNRLWICCTCNTILPLTYTTHTSDKISQGWIGTNLSLNEHLISASEGK